ncbi:hypothetical protein ACTJKQ_14135 [Acidovorax sp. 22279]|uniref:hypothetical protein n=1 Tax=Acidovorax sp. 22279 TaxID=3453900 RepID=UPI003F83CD61
MALSDERIWASDAIMRANAAAGLPMPILGMLCRTVEAEVRKDDEALIRQLVEAVELGKKLALTGGVFTPPELALLTAASTAARARLAPPPPTA